MGQSTIRDFTQTKLSSDMTVHDLQTCLGELKSKPNRERILKFIQDRFHERYIDPINAIPSGNKHGFMTAAISCLMIETLYCYRMGWEDTSEFSYPERRGKGEEAFEQFFKINSAHFEGLVNSSKYFYKNVRCGILHQGETYRGWRIQRNGKLYDKNNRTLNAARLFEGVCKSLDDYIVELRKNNSDSDIWIGLQQKLRYTIDNCQR